MLEERKSQFKKWERATGSFLSKLPFSANTYTISSIFFALLASYLLFQHHLLASFFIFFFAGIFDLVDGAVARFQEKTSKQGAYLDTIFDRYVEGIMLLSFLFLPLPEVLLPSSYWILFALFGSLMTTYAKAAAKEKELINKENRKGFFGRPERIITLFTALFLLNFNFLYSTYLIILLAILSNLTELQRIAVNLRENSKTQVS